MPLTPAERQKRHRQRCAEHHSEVRRVWRENNGDKLRAQWRKQRARRKEQIKENPALAAASNLRSSICQLLNRRGIIKAAKTRDMIGYEPRLLCEWAHKNNYRKGMHIDHIVPISWWLKRYPNDFARAMKGAWNLANLRVIPAIENLRKSDKLEYLV